MGLKDQGLSPSPLTQLLGSIRLTREVDEEALLLHPNQIEDRCCTCRMYEPVVHSSKCTQGTAAVEGH